MVNKPPFQLCIEIYYTFITTPFLLHIPLFLKRSFSNIRNVILYACLIHFFEETQFYYKRLIPYTNKHPVFKTMIDKFMYSSNDGTQNCPFCRLQFEMFRHLT